MFPLRRQTHGRPAYSRSTSTLVHIHTSEICLYRILSKFIEIGKESKNRDLLNITRVILKVSDIKFVSWFSNFHRKIC